MEHRKQWFCFAFYRTKDRSIIFYTNFFFKALTFFIVAVCVNCLLSLADAGSVLESSVSGDNVILNFLNHTNLQAERKNELRTNNSITKESFIDKRNSFYNATGFTEKNAKKTPGIDKSSFVAIGESQSQPSGNTESNLSSVTSPDKTVGVVHVENSKLDYETNVNNTVDVFKNVSKYNQEGNIGRKVNLINSDSTKIKHAKNNTLDEVGDISIKQVGKNSVMAGTNLQSNGTKRNDGNVLPSAQFIEGFAERSSPAASESVGLATNFAHFIMEKSVLILKIAAVLSAIAMQVTPIPTIRLISRAQSTGDLDGLPYIMLMFSAFLWMVYGILRVDAIIVLPNITGLLLGGWYVVTYHVNCNNSMFRKSLDDYYKICCLVVIVLIVTLVIIGKTFGIYIMGLTSAFFNVISYGAPLAGLRTVIKDKSTACMPAEVSIGNFVCSSLWLAYGCVVSDLFVIVPNLLGVIVGSLQLGLLAVFPPPKYRGFSKLRGKMELFSSQKSSSNILKDDDRTGTSWHQTNYNATVNDCQNNTVVQSAMNVSSLWGVQNNSSVSPILSCSETYDTCSLHENMPASSIATQAFSE